MNNTSTVNHLYKKLFFLLFLLPILLKANSNNYQENQPDFLECPTTNLVIASSQINEELINRWLNENSLAFESNIKNLGGIWASDDIIINHDYRGNLPSSVCNEEDGGLLVIFKATNSEKDVIRCGANLILLDDELIIPEETAITKFNSSNSLKSSIDSWLVTYPVSLRNLIADGPSKEFKENLIITHDYNGTLPNWTCQAENDNELIITFTIEDQCGNVATHEKKIVVEDNRPPTLAILSPIEVERRESFSPENIGSVVAVDECTPPADISLTYTDDISRINVDTILRKWMATDLCGNSDTILQIIKLVDRERFLDVPCAPDNVIISCRGNTANSAEISLWRTQIEENLKNTCFLNDATELSIHTSGASLFPSECGRRSGGTIFDYTISDSLGNFTIKRAKATIIDNVPPVLSTLNDGGVILRDSPFSLTVGLEMSNYHTRALQLGNSSFEAQCSNVQLRNDNTYPSNPNKDFPKRRYLRYIFDYRDDCGNRTVLTPSFFIEDALPPRVNCEPLDKVLICLGDTKNELAAEAWDANNLELLKACAVDQYFKTTVSSNYNFIELSGKCGESKSKIVTYTIADELGNTTFKTATFSIEGGFNPCGELDVQSANNQLIILNPIVPNSIIKVFDKNYQIISNCSGDCAETITISDLPTGEIYQTDIQFYDENWQLICEDTRAIKIISGVPCDTTACQGDVLLQTQEEVDAFCGCAVIEGNLTLRGIRLEDGNLDTTSTITDISVFNMLERIKGRLVIWDTEIENLSAFNNLVEIESSLTFYNNQQLNNLLGFSALTKIEHLVLLGNPNIENLQGLENVLIENTIELIDNQNLISVNELNHLESLEQDLIIRDNELLPSLNGLENLQHLRNITITGNPNLSDCCGVANLLNHDLNNRIIEGFINIANNPRLCDTSATILLNCQTIPTACEKIQLTSQNNQLTIEGLTAPNISTKVFDANRQLIYDCSNDCMERIRILDLPIGEIYEVTIQFYNEDSQLLCETQQAIEIMGSVPCDTSICNNNVTLETQAEVDAFCGCEVIDGDLRIGKFGFSNTSDLTTDIFDLSRFNNLRNVTGRLSIGNVQVSNLTDFANIQKIGGALQISFCPQLETIAAFNQIEQLENLLIEGNSNLIGFDAFANLVQIEEAISIRVNSKLTSIPTLGENLNLAVIDIWINDSLRSVELFKNVQSVTTVKFGFNNAMKSLPDLGELKTLEGDFTIINNALLTSVNSLRNLHTINGKLTIAIHKELENIDGLENLRNVGQLFIYDNPKLDYCCSVNHLLDEDQENGRVDGEIRIRNNSTECNSSEAITLNCAVPLEILNCEIESVVFECQGREANRAAAEAWHQQNIATLKANCLARDSGMIIVSSIVGLDDVFENSFCGICTVEGYYEVIDTVGEETTFDIKRATFEIVDTTPPTVHNPITHDTIECRNFPDLTFGWLEGIRFNLQGAGSIESCNPIKIITYQHISDDLSPDNPQTLTTRNVFTLSDRINDTTITIYLTILDTIPPTVTCSPNDIIVTAQSQIENQQLAANWNQENITLLDNCSSETCSNVVVTSDFDFNELSNSFNNRDSLEVIYTISDEHNNSIIKTAFLSFEKEIESPSCAAIAVELIGNQINIINLTAPNSIVKVFDPNYQIISTCSGDCPETVSVPNLIAGETYHTDIQLYDESWNFICEDQQTIEILGGNEPCDTSICQGDVILRTQAELDAFCECEVIEGNLVLLGEGVNNGVLGQTSDIYDLQKFNPLKTIKGDLVIWNTSIFSLFGFSKLQTIEGNLVIKYNEKIENLLGFNTLEQTASLILEYNPNLQNLRGISNIVIKESINIIGNPILSSMEALPNLENLNQNLAISDNAILTDLSGLKNLKSLTNLIVENNQNLSDCCSIAHLLDEDLNNGSISGNTRITNNLQLCNSSEEILQTCQSLEPCDTSICQGDVILQTQAEVDAFCGCEVIEGDLEIGILGNLNGGIDTPPTNIVDIKNLKKIKQVKGNFILAKTQLENLENLENLIKVNGTFIIAANPNLKILRGLEQLQSTGLLFIKWNNILINLNDLVNLRTVDGLDLWGELLEDISILKNLESTTLNQVTILNCNKLVSLEGLNSITSINFLSIAANKLLTNINSLSNLNFVESLTIANNPLLNNCCGVIHLIDENLDNGIVQGRTGIGDNLNFCNSPEEIIQACQTPPPPCENVQITLNNNQIIVDGLTAPNEIVKVFDENFNIVFQCIANCEEEQIKGNFPAGRYTVDLQLYDENWAFICAEQRTIILDNSNPCNTADCETTPPVLANIPADITVECDAIPSAPINITATDNCDSEVEIEFSEFRSDGGCVDNYTLTRTWTARDDCGNSATSRQVITVIDSVNPILANTPADETVECDAIPIDPVITATDNCDSNVRILFVEERTNGICEDNFVLTRTWTASDNCGNSTTRQQTITIIDSTSPVLANIPADVTVECDAIPSIPPNITATDNCDADVEIELSEERTSSDCEDSYILTRTYIATDNCGNTTQAVQVIVVQDITPPILMNLPADLTFNAEEGFDTTFPIATDNCDANVDLTVEDVVNATETEIVRTFRATDNCGNFTAAEQIITIIQDGNNLCDNISISATNDAIILSNVDAPNAIVKVFDATYQIIYECTATCESELVVPVLGAGVYHTDVQFYDEGWAFICEDKQDIEVINGGEPCDTSICQGDVTLSTQAEVDAFCGCEVIEGNLTIGGPNLTESDINDLSNLNNLEQVQGALGILDTKISNFNGLNQLTTIGNIFYFHRNNQIENFEGLANLERIGSTFFVEFNNSLESMSGLNKLDSLLNLSIIGNNKLQKLDGLNNLKTLRGLSLSGGTLIDNFDLLKQIENTIISISITGSDYIENLNGLEHFDTLGGLFLGGNKILNDVSALKDLQYITGNLLIEQNRQLENCCIIKHLLSGGDRVGGNISFGANKAGSSCDDPIQFERQCLELPTICETIRLNSENDLIRISNLTAPIEIVKVFDNNYALIYQCFADCEETINLSDLATGTYHVSINAYDENWQPICEITESVAVAGNAQDRNINFSPADFTVFPNPARTEAYIDLSKVKGEKVELVLYNQFGQEIMQQVIEEVAEQRIMLDLSATQNGLYILKIKSKNRKAVAKKLLVSRLY